jgi:hypothetical protein
MRILVNQGKEAKFTKPVGPTGAVQTAAKDATEVVGVGPVDSVKMAEYKAELDLYHKDTQEYQNNKEKVFVVILGQCTKAMKSALANGGGLEKLEENKDVVGLLEKLRELAFSTRGIQEPFVTLTESFRHLATINQGTMETMANYYERFTVSSKLLIGHWGEFYPSKLAKGSSQEGDKGKQHKTSSWHAYS